MEWFEKHLNWTCVLALLPLTVVNQLSLLPIVPDNITLNIILFVFWILSIIFYLVVSGWIISKKGHSLWWLLLSGVLSPVWLSNNRTIVEEQIASMQDKEI